MSWLISHFEPFGKHSTNSSQLLLQKLSMNAETDIVLLPSLPVSFAQCWPELLREINRYPQITGVLALGQAEGRKKIGLERVALNWIDTRSADNLGHRPPQGEVSIEGPKLLWSNIPWEQFPDSDWIERSYSAGTYVCNALMYHLLNWSGARGIYAGFVHIPLLESQAHTSDQAVMPDQVALQSLTAILQFLGKLGPRNNLEEPSLT